MPVEKPPKAADKAEEPAAFDPKTTDGFHVMKGREHLGTYETEADAQAYIDGHLDGNGDVVQGHDPEPTNEAE